MLLKMDSKDLKYLMDTCGMAVDKKGRNSLPALRSIHCEITDKEITGTATDGYRIHRVTVPCSIVEGEPPVTVVLPPIKVPAKSKYVFIEVGEKEVTYEFDSTTKQVTLIETCPFPNMNRFIPTEEPSFSCYIDPQFLFDATKPFKDKEAVRLEFYGELDPVMIRWKKDFTFVLPRK